MKPLFSGKDHKKKLIHFYSIVCPAITTSPRNADEGKPEGCFCFTVQQNIPRIIHIIDFLEIQNMAKLFF